MRPLLAALLLLQVTFAARAHDHPLGIDSEFLNTVRHPNADALSNPRDKLCCTNEDAVRVRYRVDASSGADVWFVWLNDEWKRVPDETIVPYHAPSGQAYVFTIGTGIRCFVRPRGHF